MKQLAIYLQAISFFPPALRDSIFDIVNEDIRQKNEFYHKAGRVCPYIWYLESGLIRIYQIKNGKEVTIWIQEANEIFMAPDSTLDRTLSGLFIQAIEPTVAWRTTIEDVERTCEQHPEFHAHYRRINAIYRRIAMDRETDLTALTTTQRFEKLLKKHPSWFHRVPHAILQSYLGMSKNTYEDLRKIYGV